jgi:hypothetical protein
VPMMLPFLVPIVPFANPAELQQVLDKILHITSLSDSRTFQPRCKR